MIMDACPNCNDLKHYTNALCPDCIQAKEFAYAECRLRGTNDYVDVLVAREKALKVVRQVKGWEP